MKEPVHGALIHGCAVRNVTIVVFQTSKVNVSKVRRELMNNHEAS